MASSVGLVFGWMKQRTIKLSLNNMAFIEYYVQSYSFNHLDIYYILDSFLEDVASLIELTSEKFSFLS